MPDLTIHAVPDPLLDTITARLRDAGCVYAEDEARLLRAAGGPDGWFDLVEQRAAGWPLEYVVGRAEFCGLSIAVDAGVFIPRRRTEFLAMRAVGLARPASVVPTCAAVPARSVP